MKDVDDKDDAVEKPTPKKANNFIARTPEKVALKEKSDVQDEFK